MKDKKTLTISLIAIIIILLGIMVFFLVIKPSINNYAIEIQNQAVQYTILTIMQQGAKCQTIPLNIGNQTMDLIWTNCLKQATT